tara:strand:+ start:407 stop:898 length:492 start_codon:yes stop_codon:yes gene_type:complete
MGDARAKGKRGNQGVKCPKGCTCGRHKNGGNDPDVETPIRMSTIVRQREFIAALKMNAGVIQPALEACDNLARSTYRNWYNTDPVFAAEIDDIQIDQMEFVESKLMKAIKSGSERMIEFYLDRRDPRFARKTFVDLSSKGEAIAAPNVVFVPATDNESQDDAE